MINKPRGTKDIYNEDMKIYNYIKNICLDMGESYGYSEIQTPVFEAAELFQRSVGQETDIVQKEMYTFEDKSGRMLSLRPEGTASVMRSYIEDGIFNLRLTNKIYVFYTCI